MHKGLTASLLLFVVSLVGVTAITLHPHSNDRIRAVLFSSGLTENEAILAVIKAGGQPVTTAFSGRIVVVGTVDHNFHKRIRDLGALFQFRALGAWGLSLIHI